MTLIEVIAVLAIVAVLASLVLPALIKQTDNVVATQETATLQSFGNAFQNTITRNRRIPGVAGNDWSTNIANELGMHLADVTNNIRRQPRIFLIDTNGFGDLTLPYLQTNSGTLSPTNVSFNPRLMIVSSLGAPLPLASGGPLYSDFNDLWNWDSTKANFPTSGIWAGWTGNPYDVVVQRINLSPLLVNLWFSYNSASGRNSLMCSYAIDYTNNPITSVTNSTNYVHGYFLKNSVLALFYTNGANNVVTDSFQVLDRDSTFVFDQNKWLNSLGNATNLFVGGSGGGGGAPGIANFDFGDMVNGFLNSPGPTATSGSLTPSGLQTNVIQSFINYMTDYTNWAAANFPRPSPAYNTALADQALLMSNVNYLITHIVVH